VCEHISGAVLTAAVARAARPPRARDDPPAWLLSGQHESFARALAALRRHDTACIADPVGSGKTYVALAVAAAWSRSRPTLCLVPAILVEQWAAVAARVGVAVLVHTHERTSRGKLPAPGADVTIIDESHRFRTPSSRRYRTLAPWLVGKRALLLTGTPVVNRPDDLLHQLRLTARDDTLAPYGVPSLAGLLSTGCGHPALRRLVIVAGRGAGPAQMAGAAPDSPHTARPVRAARQIRTDNAGVAELANRIDALRLSAAPDVAALVRVGLLRALGSSPAAFRDSLARYRGLLRHAADAAAAGRPVTRRELRKAVGADDAQLVLWALLEGPGNDCVELDPRDLPRLDELLDAAAGTPADPKAERLAATLADARLTVVFVSHRATVGYLRDVLGRRRVGWCTGSGAGIGRSRVPRRLVLAAFNPAAAPAVAPIDVIVATDVAAEGLDLQRAERIVHYDLPWTPMRLRQREGRALRLGSPHETVEVVLFRPDRAVERRLGMTELLRTKRAMPTKLGLEETIEEHPTCSLESAAVQPSGCVATPPRGAPLIVCEVAAGSGTSGDALELIVGCIAEAGPASDTDTVVLWRRADHSVVHDPAPLHAPLALGGAVVTGSRAAALERDAATLLRACLPSPDGSGPPATASAAPGDFIARLTALAVTAARDRDHARLDRLDRVLRLLRRGHTAGEAMFVSELSRCSAAELVRRLERLPPEPPVPGSWRPCLVIALGCAPAS
jgi:hypothetical protein